MEFPAIQTTKQRAQKAELNSQATGPVSWFIIVKKDSAKTLAIR